MNLYLTRYETSDQGTFGVLATPDFVCHTVELPWRDNKQNISCIPPGDYTCKLRHSRKFGLTFCLQDVPGRSFILIHSGNLAGDKSKGFKTNSAGCILLGKYRGQLGNQKAVLVSKPILREFMRSIGSEDFKLIIRG